MKKNPVPESFDDIITCDYCSKIDESIKIIFDGNTESFKRSCNMCRKKHNHTLPGEIIDGCSPSVEL